MKKPLCIYHHACADGSFAAWIVHKAYGDGNIDFHPGIYGEAPPDVSGRNVILVDFSYPRDSLIAMAATADRIMVIDHHKTAREDLIDLPDNVICRFSEDKCGAMLAWECFFPENLPPLLLDYVQDRDLWQWKIPNSREVTSAIYSHELTFETIDQLIATPMPLLINEGRALQRKQQRDVAAICRDARRLMWFGQVQVPVANVPWMYASDVAGELAKGQPFAATYYDDATGRRWSLRSEPAGADVALIAESFGGGGHKHAAGFRQTHEEAIDFELAAGAAA